MFIKVERSPIYSFDVDLRHNKTSGITFAEKSWNGNAIRRLELFRGNVFIRVWRVIRALPQE